MDIFAIYMVDYYNSEHKSRIQFGGYDRYIVKECYDGGRPYQRNMRR